jgi:hypothetical protein
MAKMAMARNAARRDSAGRERVPALHNELRLLFIFCNAVTGKFELR